MFDHIMSSLLNLHLIIGALVAFAAFSTVYTLAMPYLNRADLNRRTKAVSTERERIRVRERERTDGANKAGKASLEPRRVNPPRRSWSASTCVRRWWMPIR